MNDRLPAVRARSWDGVSRPAIAVLAFGLCESERWLRLAAASSETIIVARSLEMLGGCPVLIVDLVGEGDPVAVFGAIPLWSGALVVAVVVDDAPPAVVAALRAAGAQAVVFGPDRALLYAIAVGLASRLHDGPVQSLTLARLRLDMAARHCGAGCAGLEAASEALDAAAEDLSAVLRGLYTVVREL